MVLATGMAGITKTNCKISAWDTSEPLNTSSSGPLPLVNPWDVMPSESIESTGWANFDNFENTLSIENKEREANKSTNDERKEETPEETVVNLTEKISSEDVGSAETIADENVGNDNGKNADSTGNQVLLTDFGSADKSEEDKAIFANENVNSSESASRYYFIVIFDQS